MGIKMKIQLALDLFEVNEAIMMARELEDLIQVIEVGTPLVLKEGRGGIRMIREAFPNHEILADYKIMDAGDLEAGIAFESGASIVTVCGAAHDATIIKTIEQSKRMGRQVMVDMVGVKEIAARAKTVDLMKPDYLLLHAAFDDREAVLSFQGLGEMRQTLKYTKCAVAGGIGPDNAEIIAELKPDLVVIGSKITMAGSPRDTLKEFLAIFGGEV